MDNESAGNTVFQVLQQRHTQEKVEAEERFSREVEIAKAEARAQAEDTRQTARDDLIAEHDKVRSLRKPFMFCMNRLTSVFSYPFIMFFFSRNLWILLVSLDL